MKTIIFAPPGSGKSYLKKKWQKKTKKVIMELDMYDYVTKPGQTNPYVKALKEAYNHADIVLATACYDVIIDLYGLDYSCFVFVPEVELKQEFLMRVITNPSKSEAYKSWVIKNWDEMISDLHNLETDDCSYFEPFTSEEDTLSNNAIVESLIK
jgi:hypothetical protein